MTRRSTKDALPSSRPRWQHRRTLSLLVGTGFRIAPGLMTGVLLLNLAFAVCYLIAPLVMGNFVNAVIDGNETALVIDTVILALLFSGALATGAGAAMAGWGSLTNQVDLELAARIAGLVSTAPGLEHLESPEHAREIELLTEQRSLLAAGPNIATFVAADVVRIGALLFLLAAVAPVLVVVPFICLVPFACDLFSTRYRGRVDDSLALDIRLANSLFAMTVSAANAKELRVFGADRALAERHRELARRISRRTSRAAIVAGALTAGGWLVFAIALTGSVAFVVDQAVHGDVSIGAVVLTVLLLQRAQLVTSMLTMNIGQLLTAARVARRFLWLEDEARSVATGTTVPPERLHDGITLEHVDFAYPHGAARVLHDVSIHIPAGTAVAVVGENGAGKTTLTKLLTRMYEPDAGTITVDGTPLNAFDVHEWRDRTTATFQDFVCFELRAGDVIGVGDLPRFDDLSAVTTALDRAGTQSVVDQLDDGLDTPLGQSFEGGRELSGGQWQNLALARGQMRDGPLLLVLDEPTASLDAPTEHALFERYLAATADRRERSGAITIIVSHRFSTVRRADLILVLDGGHIVEQGSHEELLAARGLYAELFTLQAAAYR